jgi:hypothetical protein
MYGRVYFFLIYDAAVLPMPKTIPAAAKFHEAEPQCWRLSRRWWRFMSERYVTDAEGGSGGSEVS